MEAVTGVDKSLDFDLNVYLLRLILSVSFQAVQRTSSSISLGDRLLFRGRG